MKLNYSTLVILVLVSMNSCERFLDTRPVDTLSPVTYYNTETQLKFALTGVYDILGSVYGSSRLFFFGLDGDGAYAASNAVTGVHAYNSTSSDNQVIREWGFLYTGINRANLLLANVDKNLSISEAVRKQTRGEALFLRAYYYFLLVQQYGGVPLLLSPVSSPNETNKPRAPAREVYDQVLADMITAEALVPGIMALNYGGRVNKSAVRGIIARVCLYMTGYPVNDASKYADVRKWTNMVIEDAEARHALNSSYSRIFINYAQDKYDIKESLWEVEYWGDLSSTYNETGQNGVVNAPASSNPETGLATGDLQASAVLYLSYKPGDTRRDWNIANFTYNNTGASGTKTFITSTSISSLWTRKPGKFRREYELVIPKARYASPQNFPLLRYADVLLMFAEAEFALNGATPAAINAINTVRRRCWSTGIRTIHIESGGEGYTSVPDVTFTGGGGSGIVATAMVAGGKVTGITFAQDDVLGFKTGTGYTSAPSIIFTGGGGTGASATATVFSPSDADMTQDEISSFTQALRDERFHEFPFELLRKADLIRWGIFVKTMNDIGNQIDIDVPGSNYARKFKNVTDKDVLWPIPITELTLNQAAIQNPGW